MANYHEPHTEARGLRSWSRGRWFLLAIALIAVVATVMLIALYGGGDGGLGGGY